MIKVTASAHFHAVIAFAASAGALGALLDQLCYLATCGEEAPAPAFDDGRRLEQLAWALTHEHAAGHMCELHKDFAPHSFTFAIVKAPDRHGMCGGLIYSATGDPRRPHAWSVHT